MLTFEQAINDQQDLSRLCKDRDLQTHEIFKPNDFYGFASVLKEYAGIRQEYNLKCVVPHGVVLNLNHCWETELSAPVPAILSYPEYRYETYKKLSSKIIVPFSSPYLYLKELLKDNPEKERKGLIFFPAHSTHHVNTMMDYEQLADSLSLLGSEFHPITICVYWKDYINGNYLAFAKKGFSIASAGHMYDHNFLYRLYYLLVTHKYASSNTIGSSLFYALETGCSFFLLRYKEYQYSGIEESLHRDIPEITEEIEEEILDTCLEPRSRISETQIHLANKYLGNEFLFSRTKIKKLFSRLEIYDKIVFNYHLKNYSYLRITPYMARVLKFLNEIYYIKSRNN